MQILSTPPQNCKIAFLVPEIGLGKNDRGKRHCTFEHFFTNVFGFGESLQALPLSFALFFAPQRLRNRRGNICRSDTVRHPCSPF